jgi:hypothetical protein
MHSSNNGNKIIFLSCFSMHYCTRLETAESLSRNGTLLGAEKTGFLQLYTLAD